MAKTHSGYLSYLLRLWQVNGYSDSRTASKPAIWRASLENPLTHEHLGFANLEALIDFLRAQTGGSKPYQKDGEPALLPDHKIKEV